MKQTVWRDVSRRLIGDVGEFDDSWETESVSESPWLRIGLIAINSLTACSERVIQWTKPLLKGWKRDSRSPLESPVHVEQIDLFSYLQEVENQATAVNELPLPAPVVLNPAVPAKSPFSILRKLMRGPGCLWIFVHNLFGLAQWVNVYTVTRRFGGREAGGWYYLSYACEKSRQVGFWESEWTRQKLLALYSGHKWGDLRSKSGGQDIVVCIEPRRAARRTIRTPRFGDLCETIDYNPAIL
jgi:hypothetical protein